MKHMNQDFLIGASTAAHQVEGNNIYSDCWAMENMPATMFKEPSGDAVDHYNRYREDIRLLAEAGCNAYRFSIEWARIEPAQGSFDMSEVAHYRAMLQACQDYSMTPVVTMHHFSSPKWLISAGGWESETTTDFFARYCAFVAEQLGDLIPYICTINEANMGLQIAKIMKEMAPMMEASAKEQGIKPDKEQASKPDAGDVQVGLNLDFTAKLEQYFRGLGTVFGIDPRQVQPFLSPRTTRGDEIIMRCHVKAREAIRAVNPGIKVGLTLSLFDLQALPGGEGFVQANIEEDFLHYLPALAEDDFLGVQNYTRKIYSPDGLVRPGPDTRLTHSGYEFYPEALAGVIRSAAQYWHKPMLITENGINTKDDRERIEFIERALRGVQACRDEGIPILGYLHWSLLDNFEWQMGYNHTFGLIAVDRSTQTRYPKDSLKFLGELCRSGGNDRQAGRE